jgi:hypothetical protein
MRLALAACVKNGEGAVRERGGTHGDGYAHLIGQPRMRLEHPNIFSLLGNRALLDLRKARRISGFFMCASHLGAPLLSST